MNDNVMFQNIEILKEKFKISYREAKEVLELHDNDLIDSLIYLEENHHNEECCSIKSYLECVKNTLISMYKEGSNQRIVISRKGEVIADIPLTAVVISSFVFVLYPIILPIKLGGIILFDIDFKLVDKSGKVYDVNRSVKEKMNSAFSVSKEKITGIISGGDIKLTADEIRSKAMEFGKKAVENFNEIIESKISKPVKEKTAAYAKFVYDAENDEINEEYSKETNEIETSDEVENENETEIYNIDENENETEKEEK